jgi:hypothetical protein
VKFAHGAHVFCSHIADINILFKNSFNGMNTEQQTRTITLHRGMFLSIFCLKYAISKHILQFKCIDVNYAISKHAYDLNV